MINLRKIFLLIIITVFLLSSDLYAQDDGAGLGMSNLGMGIPWGGGMTEDEKDICPQGAHVIRAFLAAWSTEDFKTMYELIDDESKKDYSFDQARFDFQFIPFKEYRISSVREREGDYEFFLSYGDWKYGDKDLIKMMINGNTYKIIMPSKGAFFKRSI